MAGVTESYQTDETSMMVAAASFWSTYYDLQRAAHLVAGRAITQPIQGRNLQTTSAKHIRMFEHFWGDELARALGVPRKSVGPAVVHFRSYRSKSFDVCYPLGDVPKILISIKSMQNAYRNITNRVEEALGDSTVLRIYDSTAAFGFFYFVLDGPVARGTTPQGVWPKGERVEGEVVEAGVTEAEVAESEGIEAEVSEFEGTKIKKVAPFLALVEEGGDFFDLGGVDRYLKVPKPTRTGRIREQKPTARKDVITDVGQSLMDLVQRFPRPETNPKYDAMALLPTRISRVENTGLLTWKCDFSPVDTLLDYRSFIERLVATARARGLL